MHFIQAIICHTSLWQSSLRRIVYPLIAIFISLSFSSCSTNSHEIRPKLELQSDQVIIGYVDSNQKIVLDFQQIDEYTLIISALNSINNKRSNERLFGFDDFSLTETFIEELNGTQYLMFRGKLISSGNCLLVFFPLEFVTSQINRPEFTFISLSYRSPRACSGVNCSRCEPVAKAGESPLECECKKSANGNGKCDIL